MCNWDYTLLSYQKKQRQMGHWALCFGADSLKIKLWENNRIGGCMDDSQSRGNPCHGLTRESLQNIHLRQRQSSQSYQTKDHLIGKMNSIVVKRDITLTTLLRQQQCIYWFSNNQSKMFRSNVKTVYHIKSYHIKAVLYGTPLWLWVSKQDRPCICRFCVHYML